jgi:hypothetical protein
MLIGKNLRSQNNKERFGIIGSDTEDEKGHDKGELNNQQENDDEEWSLDNDDGYDLVSSGGSSSVLFEVAYEGGQKRNDNLGLGDNQIHAGRFYLMRKINKTKFKHVANCTA